MRLIDQLPKFYHKLLPSEILNFSPQETLATCHQCHMARENGRTQKPFYKPNLKCCTFEPFLPNFLVGGILNDPDLSYAHQLIRGKIRLNEFVLPIGLVAPLAYQIQFYESKKSLFGQNADFICPYYEPTLGTCEIWQYRGNVCTTFICESSYGKEGHLFWNHLGDLLSLTEQVLMEEALVNLDFSPRQVSEMFQFLNVTKGTQKDRVKWSLSPAEMKYFWNGYEDPEAFYLKTFALAQEISHKEFNTILGETGRDILSKALNSITKLRVKQ